MRFLLGFLFTFIAVPALADYSGPSAPVPFVATGATSARTPMDRAADVRTPMDFGQSSCVSGGGSIPCPVGSGGDDSGPINAAIAAVAAQAGGGSVFLPPPSSGFYNVCAATLSLPTGGSAFAMYGSGANSPQYASTAVGGPVIRILPGCASPPTYVMTETGAGTGQTIFLHDFIVDGGCVSQDLGFTGLTANTRIINMVFRDAPGGAGNTNANVYFASNTGALVFEGGRIENINTSGGSCYTTLASLPAYGINMQGHDSHFARFSIIGTQIASYEQGDFSDDVLIDVHPWNHASVAGAYGFESSGPMRLYGWTGDTFTTAAVHLKVGAYANDSEIAFNYLYDGGAFTSSTMGVLIDSGVQGAMIHDNSFCNISSVAGNSTANGVVQSGTADPTTFVYDNACASYSTAYPSAPASLNVGGVGATDQLQITGQASGSGPLLQAYSTTANAPITIRAQGTGAIKLSSEGKAVLMGNNLSTSATNYWNMHGGVSGFGPTLSCLGGDTDVGCIFTMQGGAANGQAFTFAGPVQGVGSPASGIAQATSPLVMFGSGSGSSAFRLTIDGNAAGSLNCYTLPNNYAMTLDIKLVARDYTTPGTVYSWTLPNGLLTQGATKSTTAWQAGTAIVLTSGTPTGAAVTPSADTTNGCLSLTFAPPSANTTDVWHASATISTAEVQ